MDMKNSCSEISFLGNFSSLKDEQRMKFCRGDDEEQHLPDDQGTSMEISNPVSDHNDNDNDDEVLLQSTKAQMGEVKEENERLRVLLEGIMKDYKSLQTQFFDIIQHEKSKKLRTITHDRENELESDHDHHQLVSLSLGIRSTASDCNKEHRMIDKKDDKLLYDQGLDLSLELMKFSTENCGNHESSENSCKEAKEVVEETSHDQQIWSPSKMQKTMRSTPRTVEDEVSDLPNGITTHLKKARVSVRARCEAPTMHDGCQWRKYGQKIAKGNPCPRAYYRCTVSPSCPVRKLVQRCQDDMSILITTYEGTHSHPLPLSATAMASATSAAMSMLQSRSSTSQTTNLPIPTNAPLFTTTTTNLPAGLNFTISPKSTPQQQFYFPNSTFSTSNSHPTITLDLTSPPQPPPLSASSHFRTSFPNLSFSSSNRSLNPSGYSFNDIGKQKNFLEHYYQSHMNIPKDQSSTTSSSLASAKLQTALAAAVFNSFVGNTNKGGHEINYSTTSPYYHELSQIKKSFGFGSSYLNRSTSSTVSSQQQQGGSMVLFPPCSLPGSTMSKSSTTSAMSPVEFTQHP